MSVSTVGTYDQLSDLQLEAEVRQQLSGWFGADGVSQWSLLRVYRIPFAQPNQVGGPCELYDWGYGVCVTDAGVLGSTDHEAGAERGRGRQGSADGDGKVALMATGRGARWRQGRGPLWRRGRVQRPGPGALMPTGMGIVRTRQKPGD